MSEPVLPLALHTAHARLRAEHIRAHLDGNTQKFLEELQPFVNHLMHEAHEINDGRRTNPYAEMTDDPDYVETLHVLAGVFLVGRAFEELTLIEHGLDGELNHLCTVCGGDKSKIKPPPRKRKT